VKIKPMLGDWEVPRIAHIEALDRRDFVELEIPGRVGSLFQDLNSAPTRVAIRGSLLGDENRDALLTAVRGKFLAGQPVTFVADIVTATELQYVVIETMHFEESGARPDETSYLLVLKESPPPPPPPDPFGGLDSGLLDAAAGLVDAVGGALDAIDALANVPDFTDPTKPLSGTLDGVQAVLARLGDITGSLGELFGTPE
jgi:hypothetical protein